MPHAESASAAMNRDAVPPSFFMLFSNSTYRNPPAPSRLRRASLGESRVSEFPPARTIPSRAACYHVAIFAASWWVIGWWAAAWSSSAKRRAASSAAIQPMPAAVTAWR